MPVTLIDQDYPTTGALTVTQVESPENYTLYIYRYQDWQAGNQDTSDAVGQTQLNSDGTWIDGIYVINDSYNVVITDGSFVLVISNNLTVDTADAGGLLPSIYNETPVAVVDSTTQFTLVNAPNPANSLQLFVMAAYIGWVMLEQGIDYTLAGNTITIINGNTYSAEYFRAWYSY